MKVRKLLYVLTLGVLSVLTACEGLPLPPLPPTPIAAPATATTPPGVATPTPGLPPDGDPATATAGPRAAAPEPEPARRVQACYQMRSPEVPRGSLGDPLFPQLGNSGYDVTHYSLDLVADLAADTISGTAVLQAQALLDLAEFNLDFEGFTIRALTVNDAPAQYRRAGRELSIMPPSPLRAGQHFTVAVVYQGVPEPTDDNGAPFLVGWRHYAGGVYVASQPSGAATWYPVNDHPCDKATYTLRITVPEPYVVAANGLLQSTTDNGDTTTYVWETRNPLASYLVTVNIAEFTQQTGTGPEGLPIRNYFPQTLAADLEDDFARTPQMIELFNRLFGPYPFEAYGVVVADTDIGFALETQTLSLFGRGDSSEPGRGEIIVAHELAHQWFGDSVSLASWQDIWLNEGFATYAQWLWLEETQGRAAFDRQVRLAYSTMQQRALPPPGSPPPGGLFNAGVYLRGGLTLHVLRLRVGDDTFFRILQTYAARYHNSNATTADFIALAEEISGTELDALFAAWLYDEALPEIPEMELRTP